MYKGGDQRTLNNGQTICCRMYERTEMEKIKIF